MGKLRWGVLSTARIGVEKVIPAMQVGEESQITAIASRDLKRAKSQADALHIERAYGSYEELLADPEIDAVYIPLPNHLHVPWSIKSLEAGKHVLCEKPIAMNAVEAQDLLKMAKSHPHLRVMEAFMYRFHPQWKRTRELVLSGEIGRLATIHSFFSYFNNDPENIRNIADIGGGALLDIGCYCISLARWLFDSEPEQVIGSMEFDPAFKTDRITSGMLGFRDGSSTFTCATQLAPYQRVQIIGTTGKIEIEIPFNAPNDRPTRIWITREGYVEEFTFDICDQYTLQGDAFSRAVMENHRVPTPPEDAVANMQAIDAVSLSALNKTWM